MKIYAIIPARSGSKGLSNKNIRLILGKPLLSYSISFAKRLSSVDRIFCSTDSDEYAEIARNNGAEVPFLRSADAAVDAAMEEHILEDLRSKFAEFDIEEPDIIVWLRPTFVFRCVDDVELCIEALKLNSTITAARTVVRAENRLYKIENNILLPEFHDSGKSMIRRQAMIDSYKVFSTDVFRFKGSKLGGDFLGRNIYPVVTNSICGIDIDDNFDFEMVKNLIEHAPGMINGYL
jgi:CMP-N,N'-diacetyllegionaminic acid synthase